jgi:hypothetical protein
VQSELQLKEIHQGREACTILRQTSCAIGAVLIGLSAILAATPPAKAGPMQIELISLGAGADVTINYRNQNWYVFAGQFYMQYLGGRKAGQKFNSFCVDLDHEVYVGQKYYVDLRSTSDGLTRGPEVAYLYNKYGTKQIENSTEAAALQIALWDEVADGGKSLTSGPLQYLAKDAIANRAAEFLAEAQTHTGEGEWLDASANGSDLHRGQSVPTPVMPEPTSFVLIGSGLAGLACYRVSSRHRGTRSHPGNQPTT